MSSAVHQGTLGQDTPCRIAEIVQYSCNVERDANGNPQTHCFPIPRIFKLCRGRPAVEITKLVDIDLATGEVIIPPDASRSVLQLSTKFLSTAFHTGYAESHHCQPEACCESNLERCHPLQT
ncbi:hypothetical protein AN958_00442 [Leucoagaricus sp. SymC.cos]|nr:hypothetical protein AN958_00442 [Leucoagaricus sp. SymC.cos]